MQNFLHKPYTSARKLAKLSGKIVSTKFVLGDIITLKTRKIYELIEKRSSWDSTFNILNFPKVHDELIFWDKELKALNKRILDKVSDTVVVYSDASDIGIGACILNTNYIAVRNFSNSESSNSSTWRELKAVEFALESFLTILKNQRVTWHIDNYAVSRIIKVGSSKDELHKMALRIYNLGKDNNIMLNPVWISRKYNKEADSLSRFIDMDDWETTNVFFNKINSLWGPLTVDRFADSNNRKLDRFNAKFNCPGVEKVNAFSQNWEGESNYLVPPVKDIAQVIYKIKNSEVFGTLVVPLWKSETYWSLLRVGNTFESFVKDFRIFNSDGYLKAGPSGFHILGRKLYKGELIAFKIDSRK